MELSEANPLVSYTLKGYFSQAASHTTPGRAQFRLLRGGAQATETSLFIEKTDLWIQVDGRQAARLASDYANLSVDCGSSTLTVSGVLTTGNNRVGILIFKDGAVVNSASDLIAPSFNKSFPISGSGNYYAKVREVNNDANEVNSANVSVNCSGGTTNPPTNPNPPTSGCSYSEGQFLLNFYSEAIYSHYYNGILYAAYQDGSNFKPRHWLVAAGYDSNLSNCFAEDDPHNTTTTPPTNPNPPTSGCSYSEGQFLLTFYGEAIYAHYSNGILPFSTELGQVFGRGLDIDRYYEDELQRMSTIILGKLGVSSIDKLDQPPFLPVLYVDGLSQVIQVSREYVYVKQKHPTWSNNRCLAQAYMNYCLRTVHFVLDVAGLVPGAGELPDAINGGIYLLEGDKINAGLSLAATIPFSGWLATGGKWAKNGLKALGGSTFVSAEGLIWASRTYASDPESLHALNHVYKHFNENLNKNAHGIFTTIPTNELVGLIDAAWSKVKNNTPGVIKKLSGKNIVYQIPMNVGPLGVHGGKKGTGQTLYNITLVMDGQNANHVVTAFPSF
ncbi:hypothetical protein WBJ53_13885 [Spirosoma sp. SC4-14]|uniref:hypothetical protein n=1 Tax=Spirosoma sp. SC4-14 TaxID=3128900 RepID=UPI0030D51ADE